MLYDVLCTHKYHPTTYFSPAGALSERLKSRKLISKHQWKEVKKKRERERAKIVKEDCRAPFNPKRVHVGLMQLLGHASRKPIPNINWLSPRSQSQPWNRLTGSMTQQLNRPTGGPLFRPRGALHTPGKHHLHSPNTMQINNSGKNHKATFFEYGSCSSSSLLQLEALGGCVLEAERPGGAGPCFKKGDLRRGEGRSRGLGSNLEEAQSSGSFGKRAALSASHGYGSLTSPLPSRSSIDRQSPPHHALSIR